MLSALAIALLTASAPAVDARLVTGTGLRLREAPDANAKIIERVPLGTALPCLETSKPVTVDASTAPFCKTAKGWYFTALTEPAATDATARAAQIDALIETRTRLIGEGQADKDAWPDVYALHDLMRRRIDERTAPDDKMRARITELVFVARHPSVFEKDPRVVRDESQGPRVQNKAFEDLVTAAKGTSAHEDAAWALFQHGLGGECEGDPVCGLIATQRTACRFLAQFPAGERAASTVEEIARDLEGMRDLDREHPALDVAIKSEAMAQLAKVRACIDGAKSGDRTKATRVVDELERRWR